MDVVIILLLVGLVSSALACILIRNLLKACIALAAVSGILALIMFLLDAHLAAVFELSVCAGLVTVIFISAISMTKVHSKEEIAEQERLRRRRFVPLPVLLIVVLAGTLFVLWPRLTELIPLANPPADLVSAPDLLWDKRQADLLGQIAIILVGVFGVLIFFKEREEK